MFLCHNSQDKPEVIKIARQLQQQGLKPWLDDWELPPGISWQERLEEQIEQIKSAAVFVGNSGFGPWQKREMTAFLSEFVERGIPVIPVLLGNAPKQPRLPIFLKSLTWVDFRHRESNPMGRLIWGITQVKPDNFDYFQDSVTEKLPKVSKGTNKFENFTEDLGNDVELKMIAIPGGTFMMGSPEGEGEDCERPQHEVRVSKFFMGKYTITQAQYYQVMSENPSYCRGNDNRPVESVNWHDAREFCQRISEKTGKKYRLPSEAEWEYACRAGTTTRYSFGNEISLKFANYYTGNDFVEPLIKLGFRYTTNVVGKYLPNAFGLYDMHGNVWEWCEDDWHVNYKDAPNDGSVWLSESGSAKVARGGSFFNKSFGCRSAKRFCIIYSTRKNFDIGFRVVCDFNN